MRVDELEAVTVLVRVKLSVFDSVRVAVSVEMERDWVRENVLRD